MSLYTNEGTSRGIVLGAGIPYFPLTARLPPPPNTPGPALAAACAGPFLKRLDRTSGVAGNPKKVDLDLVFVAELLRPLIRKRIFPRSPSVFSRL